MICMAFYTGIGISGMHTLFVPYPFCKLVMTVKTFAVRYTTSQGVTSCAIRDPLILGMWRCKVPWTY